MATNPVPREPGGMSTYISPRSSRTVLPAMTWNSAPGAKRRLPPPFSANNVAPRDANSCPPRISCPTFNRASRHNRNSSTTPGESARSRRAIEAPATAAGPRPRNNQVPANATSTADAAAAYGIQRRRAGSTLARHSASVARRIRCSASGDNARTLRFSRSTRSSSDSVDWRSFIGRRPFPATRRGMPGARAPVAIQPRSRKSAVPARSRAR